jgi:hypothetical protein
MVVVISLCIRHDGGDDRYLLDFLVVMIGLCGRLADDRSLW